MESVSRTMSGIIAAVPIRSAASAAMGAMKAVANTVGQTLQSPNESSKDARPHDTLEEKRHQEILRHAKLSLNRPVGVLSVHVKQAEIIDLNPTEVFSRLDLTVYIRIHVGKLIKCTCAYDGVTAPTTVVFDSLKQFPVEVSPKRDDSSNFIRVEIMAFDKEIPSCHHILAIKEMHIYDIIKKQYCVENINMNRIEKLVAVMDVEFCFTYGVFGYGYSNQYPPKIASQFDHRQRSAKDQVAHSMFCREDPPADRTDGFRNIMIPQPTGHPPFIHFSQKVDIGDTVQEFKSEMSFHDWQTVEEPVLLVSRIKRRMHKMQSEYNEQPTRNSRIAYLTSLVRNNVPPSEGKKGVINVPEGFKLRRREHGRTCNLGIHGDVDSGLLHSVEGSTDREDIDALSKVMQQAPGIVERQKIQLEYLSRTNRKQEEATNESQEVAEKVADSRNDASCPGFLTKLFRSRANRSNVVSTEVPRAQDAKAIDTNNANAEKLDETKELGKDAPPQTITAMETPDAGDRKSSKFGKRLAQRSKLTRGHRTSISTENSWDARRASFLESAAVRLRALVTHDEPMKVPKITLMPSTPEDEYSDLEDLFVL